MAHWSIVATAREIRKQKLEIRNWEIENGKSRIKNQESRMVPSFNLHW